ncbi:MAG: hypothetical protein QG549_395 [Patescibacteria group bacterium]|nr:hypothetical protein [Patescibacteria group bacterium]
MYTPGMGAAGGGGSVAGGVILLPNTGGNELLFIVSVLSIAVGTLIIASTVARVVAKKFYKN